MNPARFWSTGMILIIPAALLINGCKPQTPHPTGPNLIKPAVPTTGPVGAEAATATPADNPAPLPEVLSKKTTAYAQSLNSSPVANPDAPKTAPTKSDPSAVQWGATGSSTTPKASIASAAANTPTSVTPVPTPQPLDVLAKASKSNTTDDVPAIVPESADLPGAQPAAPTTSDSLQARINQRVHDNPRDIGAQLDSQLLLTLEDQPAPQLASISELPTEDRELISTLIDGLTNFRAAVRQDSNMLLAGKIRPLLDMSDRLRAQAELSVPTVALCTRVDGFGRYEVIDPPRFRAGQENPVIVYCEIENFDAKLNDNRMWETRLTQEVTCFTETGMLVWKDKSRDVSDTCRNRRHDFFMYDLVHLPANLTVGRYVMKVTVVDRNANRVAEKTVPIEIAAD